MHFLKKCIHNEWIRKIDGWIITLKFCNVVYKIKIKLVIEISSGKEVVKNYLVV